MFMLFAALLFLAVIALAVRLLSPRRPAKITEPSCGKCGYCVRGIAVLTCPECGSDLREVGILTTNTPKPSSAITKAILWSLALPIPALVISWILLATVLPFSQKQKTSRTILCQTPYANTVLWVFSQKLLWQPAVWIHAPVPPQDVTVINQAARTDLFVNLKTGAYSYLRSDGSLAQQPSGFSGLVLANWLGIAGIDSKDPRVLELADSAYAAIVEIPLVVNTNRSTPLRDHTLMQVGIARPAISFIVHDEPSPWTVAGLAAFWVLVWLYGLRRIQRSSARSP